MDFKECRHFIRHPMCFPIFYKMIKTTKKDDSNEGNLSQENKSKTINISLGGLLFTGKKLVDPGSRLIIQMPFENKIFNVRAKTVRCVTKPKTKLYKIAVCFNRPQEAIK